LLLILRKWNLVRRILQAIGARCGPLIGQEKTAKINCGNSKGDIKVGQAISEPAAGGLDFLAYRANIDLRV
jgi:hypothetical protein